MLVKDLIRELSNVNPELEFEVTVAIDGMDAEMVHDEFMFILQNGRFTIHVS